MPIEIDKGPGGVDAAYGKRTTLPTRNYDVTKVYGDTFREDGDGPVNHIVKEDENGNVGIGTATPVGSLNVSGTSSNPAEIVFTRSNGAIGEKNWYERVNSSHSFEIGRMDDLGGSPSPKVTVDKNGNVGIGISSPASQLHIAGSSALLQNGAATDTALSVVNSLGSTVIGVDASTSYLLAFNSRPLSFYTGGVERMRIDASGNVGIGVTPSAWSSGGGIDFNGNASVGNWSLSGNGVFLGSNFYYASGSYKYKSTATASMYTAGNGSHAWFVAPSGTAGGTIAWTQAMTLDTNGHLGLGYTPSAWASGYKAVEFSPGGAVWGNTNGNGNFFSTNLYYDGAWKYKNSFPATYYRQAVGEHSWHVAPSGTAGNTATLTQAVTLDNNGNFQVTGGGGLGYGTGSGGTVTQLTSKATAVTLNKPAGRITTAADALAAGAAATFQVNSSSVADTDVPSVVLKGGYANPNTYSISVDGVFAGFFKVTIKNISGGSLSEAVVLNFAVIKGATS